MVAANSSASAGNLDESPVAKTASKVKIDKNIFPILFILKSPVKRLCGFCVNMLSCSWNPKFFLYDMDTTVALESNSRIELVILLSKESSL